MVVCHGKYQRSRFIEVDDPGWRRRTFILRRDGTLEYVRGGKVFHIGANEGLTFYTLWPSEDSYYSFTINKDGRRPGKRGSIEKDRIMEYMDRRLYDWDAEEWLDGLDTYGLDYDL